ncbi:uncharacterized protein LOC131226141 isoform X3 [Magnolia sinica]|uniref:uncharacterized protein LOC131226141 isoform X3 n=1 Tax=Magnolia sinica TaxID=86752 RepID=UPI00265B4D8E|nr:uncharacterized protein LOC131226141 isoform X3 [Magnolia sinica]
MFDNPGSQVGAQVPSLNPQPNPFGNTFSGTGSGLIRGGLGAYGEKILGSSSEYVQSNGHWTRITEPVGGRLSYKPPIYDINAPDLYIPLMAFVTYVVLAGFSLGLLGKFSPEALSLQFTKGLLGWFLQVALLKVLLYSLGSGEAPLLDIIAYAGYAFTGMSVAVLAWIFWSYAYYFMMPWMCICMAVFLVKTVKRVLFAEVRSHDKHSSIHHYLLLFMAVSQFPLFFWLGNVGS